MDSRPVTVVETREFQARAAALLAPEEVAELIEFIAYHPTVGVVMPGTGGVRKLRWGARGKGRRGGVRVVYFHHGTEMPVFLLTAYAKSDKEDLTATERRTLRRLMGELISRYEERRP